MDSPSSLSTSMAPLTGDSINLNDEMRSDLISDPVSARRSRQESHDIGYEEQMAQELDYMNTSYVASPAQPSSPATPSSSSSAAIATTRTTPKHQKQQQRKVVVSDVHVQARYNEDQAYSNKREISSIELATVPQGPVPNLGTKVSSESEASQLVQSPNLPTQNNDNFNVPRFGNLGVYGALIGAQMLWSGFHLFAKVAFTYMHPLVLPMIRAFGTAPIMFIICYSQDRNFWRLPRQDLIQIAILGCIICAGCQNLFNTGLMLTTAADGGITQPAIPVFAALMAIVLKRETASYMKGLGILCAVAGTICIVVGEALIPVADTNNSNLTSGGAGDASTHATNSVTPGRRLLGIGCFMLQCFLFSIYLLLQKPLLARIPTITITFYTFLFGIPGTTIIAAYFTTTMDWAHLPPIWFGSMAYTISCASVGGFLLFSYATKHLPASASSMGVTLQPFFSSLLGATILGEVLTYMHVVGGLFLIAGLAIVLYSRHREAQKAAFEANLEKMKIAQEADGVQVAIEMAKEGDRHIDAHLSVNTTDETQQLVLSPDYEDPTPSPTSDWALPRSHRASVDGTFVVDPLDEAEHSTPVHHVHAHAKHNDLLYESVQTKTDSPAPVAFNFNKPARSSPEPRAPVLSKSVVSNSPSLATAAVKAAPVRKVRPSARQSSGPPQLPAELDFNPAKMGIDDSVATGSSARRASDIHANSVAERIRKKVNPEKMAQEEKSHPRLGPESLL